MSRSVQLAAQEAADKTRTEQDGSQSECAGVTEESPKRKRGPDEGQLAVFCR